MKLQENEIICLEELYDNNEFILTFKSIIKETKLTSRQVKRAVRSLVKQGKVSRETAWDEEGFIRGSGFIIEYETYKKMWKEKENPELLT